MTRFQGILSENEIAIWETGLKTVLSEIEENETFCILFNLCGFSAQSMDAHKRFSTIIPSTLEDYGWKVGYIDLFKE